MLEGYKVPKDRIFIGTQTSEDYEAYSSLYGTRCNVILSENAENAAGNRNALLECASKGSTCLMLDDDERAAVTGMLQDECDKFGKRLTSYLKRYGLSKCRFSTYWADR